MSTEVSKIIRNSVEYKKCVFNGIEWEVPSGPANNEIWYTSSDGNIITPSQTSSLPEIDTNTYSDGKGIIKFKTDVTSIGEKAFINCSGLTSVIIPNSVISIENMAFSDCYDLISITIGNGVTNIENEAFNYCENLTSITCKAINPPTLDGTPIFDNTNNCPIYVPAQSVDLYKTARYWSAYASRIQAI